MTIIIVATSGTAIVTPNPTAVANLALAVAAFNASIVRG